MRRKLIYKICHIIIWGAFLGAFGSCGIYTTFQTPQYEETENAFGTIEPVDTTSIGDVHWRDFFTDEKLRGLIETALQNNADIQTALLTVQMAQASLRASKLAFFPALDFSPNATYNNSWEVRLPVNASWEIDLFGNLRNVKKKQQAALLQTEAYAQAVRSQLIATVAATYYTLLNLDAQYSIYEQTEKSWKQNVEVTRHLMNAGRFNAASLSQTEASYYDVLNNLIDIRQEIQATENRLHSLLGETPHAIERGTLAEWQSPEIISTGIPVRVLSARPDIRQAEMALAQTFYATNAARSAFYPSLTISGNYDFKESAYSIVGSLFQPLFQRGALKANLDIAKAEQNSAAISFKQAIIDAGIEVNDALAAAKSAQAKQYNYNEQVKHLENAVNSTQLLMKNGSTTYLEVLTAQQTLLSAQISRAVNHLSEISNVITLYQALGGGINY